MTERSWERIPDDDEDLAHALRSLQRAADDAVARARAMGLEPVLGEGDAGLPFDPQAIVGCAPDESPPQAPAILPRAAE